MTLTPNEVRDYWKRQAQTHGQSVAASWADQMAVELEIAEVLRHLVDGQVVLDAGCANGYSTVRYAQERQLQITGLDYIPEMVKQARERWAGATASSSVSFDVGDITDLPSDPDSFDRVVVTRVLINLGGEDGQRRALAECARVLKPGGMLILCEATIQGWRRLNALRNEWQLPDIPMPNFNNYVDQDLIGTLAPPDLTLTRVIDFASTYFVGTRVLKPLLAQAVGIEIDLVDPNAEWNRWFASLPPWGDYGTQKCFLFQKP